MNLPAIKVTETDLTRLRAVATLTSDEFLADLLISEVNRAEIVSDDAAPRGFVAMGSTIEFVDRETAQQRTVTLVYPGEADIAAGKLSVLTPVGAALIGLSAGQSFNWRTRSGQVKELTVLRVW